MIREGAMNHNNVRAVLYGRRNRLKEAHAGNAATNDGDGSAGSRQVRRRAEDEGPMASATVPGESQAVD